jgi:hypothetical protein
MLARPRHVVRGSQRYTPHGCLLQHCFVGLLGGPPDTASPQAPHTLAARWAKLNPHAMSTKVTQHNGLTHGQIFGRQARGAGLAKTNPATVFGTPSS